MFPTLEDDPDTHKVYPMSLRNPEVFDGSPIRDVRSGWVRFLGYFWPNRNRNRLPLPRKVTNRNRNCGQQVGHGCLPVATGLQPVGTVNNSAPHGPVRGDVFPGIFTTAQHFVWT